MTNQKNRDIIVLQLSGESRRRIYKMTYFSKGKKMWHYPSNRTIERLRANGYREIVWGNGDFICI